MILNGNQRGGGRKLASHLCNVVENDHVELHELRGFCSETLHGALQETDAVAKGTQCKQYLFSLSLNPPETEDVPIAEFEAAISAAEEKLGIAGQPRAVVFHEKNGRRHAHVVWSRIDAKKMKAINLPFYQSRLTELSKDLFLEHNWRLPDGLRDKTNRNPTNFDLAEWQQAKRAGKDSRDIKRVFQEAWQISDSAAAFAKALEDKGYYLARGDRRGYVAVDAHGEVYAIPRWAGVKTKEARLKLGSADTYQSVDQTKAHIAQLMQPVVSNWTSELERRQDRLAKRSTDDKTQLKNQQRAERQRLRDSLHQRQVQEAKQRQARFRRGLSGLWDRLRGEHKRIREENQREAWLAHLRYQKDVDQVIFRHLEERRNLQRQTEKAQDILLDQLRELEQDRAQFDRLRADGRQPHDHGPRLQN